MTLYFDTRNGMVAIVETDTPDDGFVPLKDGQSTIAARYGLDEDGNVIDLFPGKTDDEVLSELAAQAQADGGAPQIGKTTLSRLEFMDRFTLDELAGIYQAAKSDVTVEVWMDKLKVAEFIDITNPVTIAGVQALEAAGLIGKGRADEILAVE